MTTYAVYVVAIEDTEEDDQHLLGSVVSGERLQGDLPIDEAEYLLAEVMAGEFGGSIS